MKRLIITISILFSAIEYIYGQLPQSPVAIPSPNATDIGRYGEFPVSPYTGNVDISIPLHTIKYGNHELPITLNYIGGGVKIDNHPGWVGLNWMLSAGGAITRSIRTKPDEFNPPNRSLGIGYRHNLAKAKQLMTLLKSGLYNGESLDGYNLYINDYEPDIFIFNFCGYHGQFMLDTDGKWVVNCDRPVKVKFDGEMTNLYNRIDESFHLSDAMKEDKLSSYYRKFSIIGDDGTIYEFGDDENAIEFSVNILNQERDYLVPVTWNLTKIKYTDGRIITFSYMRDMGYEDNKYHFIAQMYASNATMSTQVTGSSGLSNFGSYSRRSYNTYQGVLIMPSYLNAITAGSSYVAFLKTPTEELTYDWEKQINPKISPSNAPLYRQNMMPILRLNGDYPDKVKDFPNCLHALKWQKLDRIFVEELNADQSMAVRHKSILLSYKDTPDSRLMLERIDIGEKYLQETTTNNYYKFDYYYPEKLPSYLSDKHDHWGYFNDRPDYAILSTYQSHEPNKDALTYGALKTIYYPTKGATRFEYEPHYYKYKVNDTRDGFTILSNQTLAGGIRIKSILNSSTGKEADFKVWKRYSYVDNYHPLTLYLKSSGVLLAPVCYTTDTDIVNLDRDETYKITVSSCSSALPFTPLTETTHVGYSEVAEIYPDRAYSIYKFTNFNNGFTDRKAEKYFQKQTPYSQYTSLDMCRGKLLSKSDYSSDGTLLEKIEYTYELDTNLTKSVALMHPVYDNGLGYPRSWYLDGSITLFPYFKFKPVVERYSKFDKDGVAVKGYVKNIEYNDYGFVKATDSSIGNRIYYDTYAYPYDFRASRDDCSRMVQLNNISPIVEHHQYVDHMHGKFPLYTEYYKYMSAMGPVEINHVRHAGSVNDTVQSVMYAYDRYGNLTGERYNDGKAKLYVWGGTANDRLMYVTSFYSLTPEKFTSFTNLIYGLAWKYHNILNTVSSTAGAEVFSFQYNTDGTVKSLTDTRGRTYNYTYDNLRRLLNVVDADGVVIESFRYNINLP